VITQQQFEHFVTFGFVLLPGLLGAGRDWLANPSHHPGRAAVIERLRTTGVLDLPGADLGW